MVHRWRDRGVDHVDNHLHALLPDEGTKVGEDLDWHHRWRLARRRRLLSRFGTAVRTPTTQRMAILRGSIPDLANWDGRADGASLVFVSNRLTPLRFDRTFGGQAFTQRHQMALGFLRLNAARHYSESICTFMTCDMKQAPRHRNPAQRFTRLGICSGIQVSR